VVVSFDVADGRVARIYAMRNPEKLGALEEPTDLVR
jgi:hypothetical protein